MARTSIVNGKRVQAKLTIKDKKDWHDRYEALASDLAAAQEAYAQEAQDIAKKHGRTMKWTCLNLFMDSCHLRGRRRVNRWNVFLMAKLRELNTGRSQGECVKLPDFIAQNKLQLLEAYQGLSEPQLQTMIADVEIECEKKVQGSRANPKAVQHMVTAAFSQMDREWTALCAKTGIEGFYIAVHGSIKDLSEPKLFFTEKAEKFVTTVLKVDPRRLRLQLESWSVSGINVPAVSTHKRPLNQIVSECRTIIQDELKSILSDKNVRGSVKMNYNNYKCAIVERFSVILQGWPLPGRVQNPGKVGAAYINKLLEALQSEKCKWVALTADELKTRVADSKARQARGENVYKACRRHATTHDKEPSVDSGSDVD